MCGQGRQAGRIVGVRIRVSDLLTVLGQGAHVAVGEHVKLGLWTLKKKKKITQNKV